VPLPDLVALLLVLATLFWFLIMAKRRSDEIVDIDEFLFYGRSLEAKGYKRTFVATGISLATVLTFFLDFGGQFGYALLVSPIAYLAGVWLLLRALPALRSTGYLEKGTTLHSFLGRVYRSTQVRLVTGAVSLLGYVGILIIELHVGVTVFSAIYSSTAALAATVVLLTVTILLYTWLGGFKAVVDTDKVQLALILLGTISGLVFLTYSVFRRPEVLEQFPLELLDPNPLKLPLALLVVMLVGNIPLQIARMSNWQRIAAVGNEAKVRTGLSGAIWMTFAFWLVFNTMGILLAALVPAGEETGMRTVYLLELMSGHGGPVAIVLYPILFVGLVAALISTADSILIPILTAWLYDFRLHRELHDAEGWGREEEQVNLESHLRLARGGVKWFLMIVIALYILLVYAAKFDFVSLLFVFFNQQLVLFAPVICALSGRRLDSRSARTATIIAVVVGWLSVWAVTIVGTLSETPDLVFYAAAVGFGASLAISLGGSAALRASFLESIKRIVGYR
jgi:Na+/proline symporter